MSYREVQEWVQNSVGVGLEGVFWGGKGIDADSRPL